jgi:D-arginine dehydrogenase
VTTETFDIAVIGAGMAGASLAAELAPYARVLVIEAEDAPGYHTTGRSAAFWEETYGGPGVVPLTMASGGYLREHGFLSPRGALSIATAEDRHKLEAYAESFGAMGIHIEWQSRAAMDARVPGLRPEWAFATWEPDCSDIDVAGLHQHYLATGRRAGTVLRVRARVSAVEREAAGWRVVWGEGQGAGAARAAIVVNAAGAWADEVARSPEPPRSDPAPAAHDHAVAHRSRSIGRHAADAGHQRRLLFQAAGRPAVAFAARRDPDVPSDAAPEELDVAVAIDRFEHVLDWRIAALERRWAGCAASPRSLARLWLRSGARRVLLVRRAGRIWHPDRAGGGLAGGANPAGTPGRRDDGGDRPGVLCPVALRHGCLTVRRSQNHHSGGD